MNSFKGYWYLVLLFLASCAVNNQKSNGNIDKIQGIWASQEDGDWLLTFDGSMMISTYGEEVLDSCTILSINQESCDKNYGTSEATFLKVACIDGQWCYEITGLNDSIFSYRETSSGKLHVFSRIEF